MSTTTRDVERTLPIPAVTGHALAGAHGLGLDDDGWEVCTCCARDWPCPAAIVGRPTEPGLGGHR